LNVCLLSRCLVSLELLNCLERCLSNESETVSTLSASRTELTSCGLNIRISPRLTVPLLLCFFVATGTCLPNRCPATVHSALLSEAPPSYSGFQASCHNILVTHITTIRSRDSSVGIATGYGLNSRGVEVRVPVGARIFSSPRRSDRIWDPPTLLPNGYWGPFLRGLNGRRVKLSTHLQLMPRSRKCRSIHPLSHTPS
jgi:hypothetical protein